jgi:hypothetical protein
MAPYLAEMLADRYAAVRGIAGESLKTLPGFGDLDFDYVAAVDAVATLSRVNAQADWVEWVGSKTIAMPGPLSSGDEGIDRRVWEELLRGRNMLPIALTE